MATSCGLISKSRLKWIPEEIRLNHEYCFFLHDECVRILKEYESANAHHLELKFQNNDERDAFVRLIEDYDIITAMRMQGYIEHERRTILNTITIHMVSDCLHHIFEALTCLEKRKIIVALNLLRKPLMDSMTFLSWLHGDEHSFFIEFTSGDPERLSAKVIRQKQTKILLDALENLKINDIIRHSQIYSWIFDKNAIDGLYGYFQHAVHLITVGQLELKTTPENFNFIFKNLADDDVYFNIYGKLPTIMLFLAHVIIELFDKIKKMDAASKSAFIYRSRLGLYLANDGASNVAFVTQCLDKMLEERFSCTRCNQALKITPRNAAKIVLTDSFRCSRCGSNRGLAFSWMF